MVDGTGSVGCRIFGRLKPVKMMRERVTITALKRGPDARANHQDVGVRPRGGIQAVAAGAKSGFRHPTPVRGIRAVKNRRLPRCGLAGGALREGSKRVGLSTISMACWGAENRMQIHQQFQNLFPASRALTQIHYFGPTSSRSFLVRPRFSIRLASRSANTTTRDPSSRISKRAPATGPIRPPGPRSVGGFSTSTVTAERLRSFFDSFIRITILVTWSLVA
jgi:hypothetical protein